LSFGLIEQRPIDVFDRGRLEIEKLNRRLHCFRYRREKDQTQAFLLRQLRKS